MITSILEVIWVLCFGILTTEHYMVGIKLCNWQAYLLHWLALIVLYYIKISLLNNKSAEIEQIILILSFWKCEP